MAEASRRAAERNEELRDFWRATVANYNAQQLIFLDESAANERTGDHWYGWSPARTKAVVYSSIKRSQRYSILPAYTVQGYLTWDIVQASYDTEMFNTFVRDKVLPLCNEFPGPRSVLVVNNARIHHSPVEFPVWTFLFQC